MRSQQWSTFVRNHTSAVLASDFFVTISATFRVYFIDDVLTPCSSRVPAYFSLAARYSGY